MMEIRKFNSVPGIILFVLQSYSCTIFLVNADSMGTPERWTTQYISFSAIVMFLTFVLLQTRDIIYKSSLILLIQIITGVMIRPLTQQPMIIYSLLISEILLFFIAIPNLFSFIPTLSLIIITVSSLHLPIDNWKIPFKPPDSVILINMVFLPLLTFAVVSYAYHRKKKLEDRIVFLTQAKTAADDLAEANIRLQNYAVNVEEASIKKERESISRELHDSIGYLLTNLKMMMEAMTVLPENRRQEKEGLINDMKILVEEGITETRRTLHQLRDVRIANSFGLEGIKKIVKAFKHTNTRISMNYGNARFPYNQRIDKIMFRTVQEGITNALRHGNATEVRIFFWQTEKKLGLTIEDNGKGIQTHEIDMGIGLKSMKDRLHTVGGELEVSSIQDGGFTLSVQIPWESSKHESTSS